MISALDREHRRQSVAGAVDPAFDGADSAAADLRGFLIGEPGGTNQDEGFALVGGQQFERPAEFIQFEVAALIRQGSQRFRIETVGILHLTAPLAILRAEQVAQNGEQPCGHVGAGLEGIEIGPGPQQRFLHEIVGAVDIAAHSEMANARSEGTAANITSRTGLFGGAIRPLIFVFSVGTGLVGLVQPAKDF
jgi:hypothetical protein